ncbi:MAG: AMP-binding protein [Micromonosporaceae bacterium]
MQDLNRRFQVGPADRVLALSALSFDLSVYDIFGSLAAGAAVVIPTASRQHDPTHWTELVDRHGVTIWNSVPALMQVWLDAHGSAHDSIGSVLRLVWLSGDWIPVSLPDAIRARYPKARIISMGGATEASIWSIWYPIGEVPPDWIRIPYGKALANQTMNVFDAQLNPCPVWTTGEIYIGGVGVANGYWADPQRTAERFFIHPETLERLYRTGDLGRYLPGGDIEFLGREDFQVKINGYRIELGEITAALRRQPGVGEALVAVHASPRTGRRQLVAYVMPTEHASDPQETPNDGDRWQALIKTGEAELREGAAGLKADLHAYHALLRAADELCPSIMARTLARLGQFTRPADTATAETIIEHGGLKPRYIGLVQQWLSVLEAQGFLSRTDDTDEYSCDHAFDADLLDNQIRLAFAQAGYAATGPCAVLFDYFVSCADQQVELLRGEVSPLHLLLPSGEWHVTEALYANNPVSMLCNRVVAQIVGRFVDQFPLDRRVRILEVGGGTGATTAKVLPQLPAERVRYQFSDISTFFTERAKLEFSSYAFVGYGVYDVDRDPIGQGMPAGSADLVIAANVMHDAISLTDSLGYLRTLLAPGGVLILIEGTANSLLQMITVGFVEGLSNHQGQRDLPFLSVAQWREQLADAGFTRLTALPDTDDAIQHVLAAEAPAGPPPLQPSTLRDALEDVLPEYMVPHHYLLIDRMPLSANGKVDLGALPTPWDDAVAEETVAPRDELERKLLAIWRDALGRDDFGVEDSFFELGGDSLHAVTILARLREEFGVSDGADAGLQRLFDNPTIATLGLALRDVAKA